MQLHFHIPPKSHLIKYNVATYKTAVVLYLYKDFFLLKYVITEMPKCICELHLQRYVARSKQLIGS